MSIKCSKSDEGVARGVESRMLNKERLVSKVVGEYVVEPEVTERGTSLTRSFLMNVAFV